jgi:2-polyprenyl-3-methyl-5-hydroxy-6-metoxy-1,4-benzoquinol methylase
MHRDTIRRIHTINLKFYQSFADPFSETRGRLQPGVERILQRIPDSASVLDMGCGNGILVQALHQRGHEGVCIGVDQSEAFLQIAQVETRHPRVQFIHLDLTESDWSNRILSAMAAFGIDVFDRIVAFAVLHHIPGAHTRLRLLRSVSKLLARESRFHLSNWNFMTSPRLRSRIVPWKEAGLDESQVEDGDYLLDWRRGGRGLRYVHLFDEQELKSLASQAGFEVVEMFYSDGEGGRLGLYQTWVKRKRPG